ncbi:hypothetical protein ACIRA0001_1987 [Acinetobacter radioresistens SK82]|uniref:Uncharacterized protein n=1 Tax=Acinetobacter radioresistens SK82 TaxID=596318 RepID=A0ABP2GL02_ACIRA|nr:hypothetical protein ACIRA0001_1987 [Acinetobacter radioresistens SK82]EXB87792.1 hypothetical protein J538_0359 [Acinetobacter sp. 272263]
MDYSSISIAQQQFCLMNKVNSELSNLVQHFINRKIFMRNRPNTMFRHKYQSTKINQNFYPKIPENVY